ncbi:hypothetical protein GCM10027186_52920 [Micromonospora schwarzwaldensis]
MLRGQDGGQPGDAEQGDPPELGGVAGGEQGQGGDQREKDRAGRDREELRLWLSGCGGGHLTDRSQRW